VSHVPAPIVNFDAPVALDVEATMYSSSQEQHEIHESATIPFSLVRTLEKYQSPSNFYYVDTHCRRLTQFGLLY
jgi:hypothetical protein